MGHEQIDAFCDTLQSRLSKPRSKNLLSRASFGKTYSGYHKMIVPNVRCTVPVETWDLPVAGSPTVDMAMLVIHYQNIQSAPNFAAHEPSRYFIKMQFKRRGRTKVESTEGDEKLKRA